MTTEPLLDASNVRIDVDGPAIDGSAKGGTSGTVIEQLTVTTSGANAVVLGAPRALFEAVAGLRDVARGTLRVGGMNPRDAIRSARVASAPVDVAMPARWNVLDLVRESARLAGHARRECDRLTSVALQSMKLDALSRTRLAGADLALRRAAMIAAALATGAEILAVEDFTPGLPDGAARSLARVFVAACAAAPLRRWIIFAGRLSLSSPLGMHADEALVFAGGRFVCAGPPGEIAARERTFSLRTSGESAPTFVAQLRERGARVETDDEARALTVTMPEDLSTHDLIALARGANVVVLELLPVSGALV